jgi:hypothetical protein
MREQFRQCRNIAFVMAMALILLAAGQEARTAEDVPTSPGGTGAPAANAADLPDPCAAQHADFAAGQTFYVQRQGAMFEVLRTVITKKRAHRAAREAKGAKEGKGGREARGGKEAKGGETRGGREPRGRGKEARGGGREAKGGGREARGGREEKGSRGLAVASAEVETDDGARVAMSQLTLVTRQFDHTRASFAQLRACRFAQAATIKAAVRDGKMPRDRAAQLLADEKRRFDEEVALARQYYGKMGEINDQFRDASDALVDDDPDAQSYLNTRKKAAAQNSASSGSAHASGTGTGTGSSSNAGANSGSASGSTANAGSSSPSAGSNPASNPSSGSGSSASPSSSPSSSGSSPAPADNSAAASPVSTGSAVTEPNAPPVDSTNPDVQVAVAATETLPEKRTAFDADIANASQQSNLTFNLDGAG